jgi:hypothetical protein|tara:strand:+ start:71 stop:451 length:381 start_codon:yes stop_codon:yes gene_type:complete
MWNMPKLNMIGNIIDKVAGHVDKFTLDKEEKAQLIMEINKAQIEVNKIEAGSTSFFKSGWRPSVGWICSFALGYHFVLQPMLAFGLTAAGYTLVLPEFDMSTLMTVLMGLLGLGGMRSFEKVKRSA